MKILARKIKNRGKYEKFKISMIALLCGIIVVGLCVFGVYYYVTLKDAEVVNKAPVSDTVQAYKDGQDGKKGGNEKPKKDTSSEKEDPKDRENIRVDLEKMRDSFVSQFDILYPNAKLSFYIKDLDSGSTIVYNSEKMNSASVIKLFIMETVFKQVEKGEYQLTEERAKALEKMITESHNDSSTLFIDDFGGVDETRKVTKDNLINVTIARSGYTNTELNRKMHDTTPPDGPTGYENYTDVYSVATLLEKIYNKSLFEKAEHNAKAMELLKSQKRDNKIPAKIKKEYSHVVVANKTGELSQVENDAAIIMGKDYNLIFVVMVNDIPLKGNGSMDFELKERVQGTIADFGLQLTKAYEESSPKGSK